MVPTCLAPGFGNWEQRLRVDGSFMMKMMALREGLRGITMNAIDRYEDLADRKFKDQLRAYSLIRTSRRLSARILLDDCRQLGTILAIFAAT